MSQGSVLEEIQGGAPGEGTGVKGCGEGNVGHAP